MAEITPTAPAAPNNRDCHHGRLKRACFECDHEQDRAALGAAIWPEMPHAPVDTLVALAQAHREDSDAVSATACDYGAARLQRQQELIDMLAKLDALSAQLCETCQHAIVSGADGTPLGCNYLDCQLPQMPFGCRAYQARTPTDAQG